MTREPTNRGAVAGSSFIGFFLEIWVVGRRFKDL
jgi:hypothetical protein